MTARAQAISSQMHQPNTFRLCFPSGEYSVRSGLAAIITELAKLRLAPDILGSAEIVLGEVLNNVVEHSYGENRSGKIDVSCAMTATCIEFVVIDDGTPMPNGETPSGVCADIDVPTEELPEGGFGWFLIKSLAADVRYKRQDGKNELSFCLGFVANR